MLDILRNKLVFALKDLKAIDIKTLDVKKFSSFTDLMIIASGRSGRHVHALVNTVSETAKNYGTEVLSTEGHQQGEWVLVDLGDIVVHIMKPPTREFYQLEKIWSQGNFSTEQH